MPTDPAHPGTTATLPEPQVPRYGEASLADLAGSLLAMVDVPGCGNPLGLDPAGRACLLVVDGLGWELLLANRRWAPFLAEAAETGRPLTAGYPSTTASSLGSLGTARPPGEHGLVGYTMALPGLQRAFNCLRWSPYGIGGFEDLRERFPPEELQPEPTVFELAASDGVTVSRLGPPEHAASGLTRSVLRGGAFVDVFSLGDVAAAARSPRDNTSTKAPPRSTDRVSPEAACSAGPSRLTVTPSRTASSNRVGSGCTSSGGKRSRRSSKPPTPYGLQRRQLKARCRPGRAMV